MAQTNLDHFTIALARRRAVLAALAPDLDLSPGSDLYDETQADAMGSAIVMYALDAVQNQAYSGTATGGSLDNLAADAGLTRQPATVAATTVTVQGASTGAPSGGWVVPALTNFFTTADASGTAVYFQSQAQATVAAGGQATIAVTAVLAGSTGNVVANAITQMDATPGVTLVSSAAPATPAADQETDDSLRGRVATARAAAWSAAAISGAALGVAGVAFASVSDPKDGSGAIAVYAAAGDGSLSGTLQGAVQTAVDAALPPTVTAAIDPYGLVRAVVQVTIAVQPGYASNVVAADVVAAIAAYVLTLQGGQTLQPGPMWAYVVSPAGGNVAGLADYYTTAPVPPPTVSGTQLLRLLAAPASPALGTAATGGALSNGTVYAQITWDTASGETLPSVETSIVLAAGTSTQTVTVPIPAFPDASVTQANVYLATSAGQEKLQGSVTTAAGGTYTQTAALSTTSAAPPAANTISAATVTVASV